MYFKILTNFPKVIILAKNCRMLCPFCFNLNLLKPLLFKTNVLYLLNLCILSLCPCNMSTA